MLGIDRKTVRNVLKEDAGDQTVTAPEKETAVWPSMLNEYREYIEIQLAKELSITRIHQDLQKEFGMACGYTTLRDYVAKIRRSTPHTEQAVKEQTVKLFCHYPPIYLPPTSSSL